MVHSAALGQEDCRARNLPAAGWLNAASRTFCASTWAVSRGSRLCAGSWPPAAPADIIAIGVIDRRVGGAPAVSIPIAVRVWRREQCAGRQAADDSRTCPTAAAPAIPVPAATVPTTSAAMPTAAMPTAAAVKVTSVEAAKAMEAAPLPHGQGPCCGGRFSRGQKRSHKGQSLTVRLWSFCLWCFRIAVNSTLLERQDPQESLAAAPKPQNR